MTQETSFERSNLYEVGFHIVPTLGEDGAKEQASKVESLVAENGQIASKGEPKLLKLAYTLKKPSEGRYQKFDTAYFSWVKFSADPASIASIEDSLKHQDGIIRFITIKTVPDSDSTTAKLNAELEEASRRRERPEPQADSEDQPATEIPEDVVEDKPADEQVDKAIDALVEETS